MALFRRYSRFKKSEVLLINVSLKAKNIKQVFVVKRANRTRSEDENLKKNLGSMQVIVTINQIKIY